MSDTPKTDAAFYELENSQSGSIQYAMRLKELRTLCEKLERELSAQWMPISSAPKDGTRILITDGVDVWPASFAANRSPEYCWVSDEGSGWGSEYVTHWQPLPPPPKA